MTTKEQNKTENKKDFIVRDFIEVPGGFYDDLGFYTTPNGSNNCLKKVFGIPMEYTLTEKDSISMVRRVSFLGGYYDDNCEYIPGEGWDETNHCYRTELGEEDDYVDDVDILEDDGGNIKFL
jgi:hypothetical protein